MICKRCGKTVPDGASFCPSCGAKLEAAADGEEYPAEQPRMPICGQAGYEGAAAQAFGVIKSACSSPAALTAAIMVTAATLLELSLSFDLFFWFSFSLRPQGSVIAILCTLPSILITFGLWLTYVSAANRRRPWVETNGFLIIRVGLIALTVLTIVEATVTGIFLFICVLLLDGRYTVIDDIYFWAMSAVAIVVVALVIVLLSMGCLKGAKLTKDMKNTALTGSVHEVPRFLSTFVYILEGKSVFILAAGLVVRQILIIALSLCQITALIAFGIFLSSYSSQMSLLTGRGGNIGEYRQGSDAAQENGNSQPQILTQPEHAASGPEGAEERKNGSNDLK